jgi:hypothetical protein
MLQDLSKIYGTCPYRGKSALLVHVLYMPHFETLRVTLEIRS